MYGSVATYLNDTRSQQLQLLEQLVLQPSCTSSKRGVDQAGNILINSLQDCHLHLERHVQKKVGDHLIFRSRACNGSNRSILLVGHMDTVFPPETTNHHFSIRDDRILGPGIIDMKGGLTVAVFLLKTLAHLGLLHSIPITLVCNSDEETGSLTSSNLIKSEAKKSLIGLVFECGGMNGEVVTARKGKKGYELQVLGRAGHAAFCTDQKSSAILALAKKIIDIEQLNDPLKQLVVNVGVISGGVGPNSVPEKAAALIDTRFLSQNDGASCEAALKSIASRETIPKTHGTLSPTTTREPMEAANGNQILFYYLQQQAKALKLQVEAELRSGVSDANTIAATGTPVLDGLGPMGDCDHSEREFMIKTSLQQRTLLATCTVLALWQDITNGLLRFSTSRTSEV